MQQPFKRYFISGGAGVIGQEMVRLLAQQAGVEVLVGDLKPQPTDFPPQFRYWAGDLNYITEAELHAFAPEVFIHLAATFERSAETYGFWEENFQHNVRLSHHLMTVVKDLPSLRRVVFASSYLIYEPSLYNFKEIPTAPRSLREDAPIWPRNLTGMAKLAHEVELRFLTTYRHEQFSSVCARIYRGYGLGSRDIISRWVRALLAGEAITVYGPESFFDYIYAPDTAEGLLRLAAAETVTGVLNLGTGRARRVADVVDILRQHFPALEAHQEPSPIPYEASQADMTAYQAAIGWTPPTTLEQSIPQLIAFERNHQPTSATPKEPGHILITSLARKVPLAQAVQAAARKRHPSIQVIGADSNAECIGRHFTDGFWQMPATTDENLPQILAYCQANNIQHIIPTRDGELSFWSRHRAQLAEHGIAVLVSELAGVARCLDKLAFADFGTQHNLPFIPAAQDASILNAAAFVVKERWGAGSKQLGLNLPLTAAHAHAQLLEEPIFQPYVAGQEISVDAYVNRQGEVHGLVMRTRDVVQNGESQVTTTFEDATLAGHLTDIISQLGLYGPVVVQAFLDEQNHLHIIECNCRFGGASSLAVAKGLDTFYWFLLEAAGQQLKAVPFLPVAGNLRQVRYPADQVTVVA